MYANNANRRITFRALALGLALLFAAAGQAQAKGNVEVTAEAATVSSQARLNFRIVIRDSLRLGDGLAGDSAEGAARRHGSKPQFLRSVQDVDGRPVLTIAQP